MKDVFINAKINALIKSSNSSGIENIIKCFVSLEDINIFNIKLIDGEDGYCLDKDLLSLINKSNTLSEDIIDNIVKEIRDVNFEDRINASNLLKIEEREIYWAYDLKIKEEIEKEISNRCFNLSVKSSYKDSPITIISGGPGSGKTHFAIEIVESILEDKNKTICIVAPTSKAVDVLRKRCIENLSSQKVQNIDFGTIHSIFNISVSREIIGENSQVFPVAYDYIIIDESSMISNRIMLYILRSSNLSKVIFLGDVNQLPPVSKGTPFKDISSMNNSNIHRLTLSGNKRSDKQDIIDKANNILFQNSFSLSQVRDVIDFTDFQNILNLFLNNINIESLFIFNDTDEDLFFRKMYASIGIFKIICDVNKGRYGTNSINKSINAFIRKEAIKKGAIGFAFPGMLTETNKAFSLFNGSEIIFVEYFNNDIIKAIIDSGRESYIKYSAKSLFNFKIAWAITIHKSQGSEYSNIAVVIDNQHRVTKEHIYTAITRAKDSVNILCKKN